MGSGDLTPSNAPSKEPSAENEGVDLKRLFSWEQMARTWDGAFLGLRKCAVCQEPIEIIRYSIGPSSVLYSIQPGRSCHLDHTRLF